MGIRCFSKSPGETAIDSSGVHEIEERNRLDFAVDPQFELLRPQVIHEIVVPIEHHHIGLDQSDADTDLERLLSLLLARNL